MRTMMVWVALALVAGWAFADEPPPIVNGNGVTLKDLVGKEQNITVVLKDSKAMDRNLRVVDIGPATLSVVSSQGERTAYRFSSVAEIRLQEGTVESREFSLDANRTLRPEEQKIVTRAIERSRELFDAPDSNQVVKIRAATYLSADGKKDANDYLHKLASSNDVATEVEASVFLYVAGDPELGKSVISEGLSAGDRAVRAKAALLAGLTGDQSTVPALSIMVRDRAKELCAPAARALGRLGIREAIPDILKMLQTIDSAKGEAAVFALARLGGSDVIEQVKAMLPGTTGMVRYRMVLLLYRLKDPTGKELMTTEMLSSPTLQLDAAPILARDGNRDAVRFLSSRLQGLYDEKTEIVLFRARAAIALMYTTDPTAVSQLQKLLAPNLPIARKEICNMIAETGKLKLLTVLQPLIEDTRLGVSLAACGSALAVARPDFQGRYVESLKE